jgi:hypothetical protein
MDQVTRKRMHKDLVKQFDRAVDTIESVEVVPSMADHRVGMVMLNGEEYEVRVVLKRYAGEEQYEDEG